MAIQSVTLGSGFNTIFNSTGSNGVSVMYFCNITPNTVTINLYAVPNNSVPSDGNIFYYAVPIAPGDTYVIDTEKLILNDNDSIQATASANNAIVVTVSTMEL